MSKREDLKLRLAVVLKDLRDNDKSDPEAIWQIGSLAAALMDKTGMSSWADFKSSLKQEIYEGLIQDFQTQGNALYQAGERRKAYAIQAIGISVVAMTQRADPQLRDGEILLDALIEGAVKIYRKTQTVN